MTPEFISLSYSPWSEKARWALDLAEVEVRRTDYQPVLGEPALRFRLKKWSGTLSVPVLRLKGHDLTDSLDIAEYAARQNPSRNLFPSGQRPAVNAYNELSERGLNAGRGLSFTRMLASKDAQAGMVPKTLRRVLGPVAPLVGKVGMLSVKRKYGDEAPNDLRAAQKEVLDTLRGDLAARPPTNGGPRTLLAEFSYADIAMAQVVTFVEPPDHRHLKMSRASRSTFRDDDLVSEYADLIAWRDELYDAYRRP